MKQMILSILAIGMCFVGSVIAQQKETVKAGNVDSTTAIQELIDSYFDSLNETDSKKRMELIKKVWNKDGVFVYPGSELKTFSAMSEGIAIVQKKFPNSIVRRTSEIELIENNYIRLSFELIGSQQESLIRGVDFIHIFNNKLKLVVGYFDYVSEKAK